jgi:hypothetical protein
MEPLELWMLIVGLLCFVYAIMVVLWVVVCKTAPQTSFWPLVSGHSGRAMDPLASDSFVDRWLRRLTTI